MSRTFRRYQRLEVWIAKRLKLGMLSRRCRRDIKKYKACGGTRGAFLWKTDSGRRQPCSVRLDITKVDNGQLWYHNLERRAAMQLRPKQGATATFKVIVEDRFVSKPCSAIHRVPPSLTGVSPPTTPEATFFIPNSKTGLRFLLLAMSDESRRSSGSTRVIGKVDWRCVCLMNSDEYIQLNPLNTPRHSK